MSLVNIPKSPEPLKASPYVSRERVYGEVGGNRVLLYPVGAPIPVEEAVRQGLVSASGETVAPHMEGGADHGALYGEDGSGWAAKSAEPGADKALRPEGNKTRARRARSSKE